MSSRPPHMGYILNPDLLQRSSFRGMGMSKAEIKAKHPPGTSPKHIEAMHKYMAQGDSFNDAHNRAQLKFPALGNTGLGHCGCAVPTCPSCNKGMGRTYLAPINSQTAATGTIGLIVTYLVYDIIKNKKNSVIANLLML